MPREGPFEGCVCGVGVEGDGGFGRRLLSKKRATVQKGRRARNGWPALTRSTLNRGDDPPTPTPLGSAYTPRPCETDPRDHAPRGGGRRRPGRPARKVSRRGLGGTRRGGLRARPTHPTPQGRPRARTRQLSPHARFAVYPSFRSALSTAWLE